MSPESAETDRFIIFKALSAMFVFAVVPFAAVRNGAEIVVFLFKTPVGESSDFGKFRKTPVVKTVFFKIFAVG